MELAGREIIVYFRYIFSAAVDEYLELWSLK